MSYELQPLRTGTARHFAWKEEWTQHDFWVSRWHALEGTKWADTWHAPDDYLLPYTANRESVINQDVVLWYLSSGHHDPTDEDRTSDGEWGITLVHWFGFDLIPHNFFDFNPLGGPERCGN